MPTIDKAESHKVEPTEHGFAVISGTSGRRYLVAPLVGGGAACSCDFGQRQTGLRVLCSHVRAVEAYVLAFNTQRREAAAKDPALTQCWLCDGSGEVEVRPVYQSLASTKQFRSTSRAWSAASAATDWATSRRENA